MMTQRLAVFGLACLTSLASPADEPPAINPFGPRPTIRPDSVPGYVELSDGTIYVGQLYLTRDARLKIHDQEAHRHREIPLRVVRRIDCKIVKEWMQKEWRFKENASNRKVYTGRTYPARQYRHVITLNDGRRIRGPMSGIIYVRQEPRGGKRTPVRFIMHKRHKGPVGSELESLVYLRSVRLGEEAYRHGQRRREYLDRNRATQDEDRGQEKR